MPSYYEVLGIDQDADGAAIRIAYRALIRRYHPDTAGGSQDRAQDLNAAYHVLSDPARRAYYDADLRRADVPAQEPPPPQSPPFFESAQPPVPAEPGRAGLWVAGVAALCLGGLALASLTPARRGPSPPPVPPQAAPPPAARAEAALTPLAPPATEPVPRRDRTTLDRDERASLDSVCFHEKLMDGPAGYSRCAAAQIERLNQQPGPPDLYGLTESQRAAIDSTCLRPKLIDGPADYDLCRAAKIALIRASLTAPALTRLDPQERALLERICLNEASAKAPPSFIDCMAGKVAVKPN